MAIGEPTNDQATYFPEKNKGPGDGTFDWR